MHSRVYSSECLAHAVAHLSPVKWTFLWLEILCITKHAQNQKHVNNNVRNKSKRPT